MAAKRTRSKTASKPDVLKFEHEAPTDVKSSTTGHAELHNVVGRAVSELQTVVADLSAQVADLREQVAATATPGPAGDEPAGSAGNDDAS